MSKKVALFWPGDARAKPNELALPNVAEATAQLEARAEEARAHEPTACEGFLSKPHESIEKLGPIDDPMVGVCVHWFYGPHTTDGVVGKDNPLLLASNFSGRWPGLVGLLNTGACLEIARAPVLARVDDAARLDEGRDVHGAPRRVVRDRAHRLPRRRDRLPRAAVSQAAAKLAREVADEIQRRRVLILMLGDTSMGMINGYFGPRLLNKHGFTEHKIDQAWIIDRGRAHRREAHRPTRSRFVKEQGASPSTTERQRRRRLRRDARRASSSATTSSVLDLVHEFKADCIGWQYQLGLIPLRPRRDFAEGLLNSTCRPESNGDTIACATEADQGNVVPMEMHEAPTEAEGPPSGGHVPRRPLGRGARGALPLGPPQLRLVRRLRLQPRPDTLKGVHSYRQPSLYFPTPGGTLRRARACRER